MVIRKLNRQEDGNPDDTRELLKSVIRGQIRREQLRRFVGGFKRREDKWQMLSLVVLVVQLMVLVSVDCQQVQQGAISVIGLFF